MTTPRVWQIKGRCFADPPPATWFVDLARRLGQRPRRLSTWAELALYGARICLDDAGESTLPTDATLRVASTIGTTTAFVKALEQHREGFLLPFSFLQSQSSQMLASVAGHLGWQGDAAYITTPDPLAAARLACLESGAAGLLLGWVDDAPTMRSTWLRLEPAAMPSLPFVAASPEAIGDMSMQYWRLVNNDLMVAG